MDIPRPPDRLLRQIVSNANFESFINSLQLLRAEVKRLLEQAGVHFSDFGKILDFGCGVGRFMLAFQPELGRGQELWGCDVSRQCADWCDRNIPFAKTSHNSIDPPLRYEPNQFDFVYALSVFTHLRLEMQFRWAWEIYRVLRPGGIFFLTLHGPSFFSIFYETYRYHLNHAKPKLNRLLPQGIRRPAATPLWELHSFGGDGLFAYMDLAQQSETAVAGDNHDGQGQVHVAAAHSFSFAKTVFKPFELLLWEPQSRLGGGQDVYILRKPLHAKPLAIPLEPPDGGQPTHYDQPMPSDRPAILDFQLCGQRMFHVHAAVGPVGAYKVACDIEIAGNDGVPLAQASSPFNNSRIYGPTHHACFELPVAPYEGRARVTLAARLLQRGTLGSADIPLLRWKLPFFS